MSVKIQIRRDLAANWGSTTVLASGEFGYETDTGNLKIGDGTTQWQNLAYYQFPNVSVNPAVDLDLNSTRYRVMGRYRLNSITPGGSTFTNVPTDFASAVDADSVSTLIVTTHAYPSLTTHVQQLLTQYSSSGSDLRQWVRLWNGTAWTNWSSTAHLTDSEVVADKIASSAVTFAKLATDVLQVLVPIGSVLPYAGSSAPSSQWLVCNGSAVSRSTYSALFGVLSTTFGSGNGSTTFNLPDLRGRTAVGVNTASYLTTLGATAGSADAIVVSHTHTATSTSSVTDPGHSHTYSRFETPSSTSGMNTSGLKTDQTRTTSTSTTGITVSTSTTVNSTGSDGTNANLQPSIALNYIIRAL
jgi:microcystin-dependent protein